MALDTPLEEGMRAGVERAQRHDLVAPEAVADEAGELARRAISEASIAVSAGGQSLFVELVTLSAIVRHAHGHGPLDEESVNDYLNHTAAFLNTFFHA